MKRSAIVTGIFVAMTALAAPAAVAAQPGAECGDEGATLMPAGFSTSGFATAEANYAGSDGTSSLNSGNDHAVSQYDIACVHFTTAHS
jgi:hypothetical protein